MKKILLCTAAFLLPVFLLLFIYLCRGIYPFGDASVLTVDLNNQYINFFSYMKQIFSARHSLWYSFSISLGGNTAGLLAYYLMSPFNWILFLFNTRTLPVGIEVITLLKTGCCGLSAYMYLCRKKPEMSGLIFSTAYAMSAYVMLYQMNIMWLDSIILLPLILWGIHHILEGRLPFLYSISLMFCILFNYYIGYMVCLFCVLYFLYSIFSFRKAVSGIYCTTTFTAGSLLAGGMSFWLLFPVFYSYEGGKAVFSLKNLTFDTAFSLPDLLSKLFIGSVNYEEMRSGLPNIYCSLTVLLFACLFFFSKYIPRKRKLFSLLIYSILILSFYLNGVNLIWHGLNPPVWFPYRYSFLFSFYMIECGWDAFQSEKKKKASRNLLPWIVLIGIAATAVWMVKRNLPYWENKTAVISFYVLLCLAGSVFLFYSKRFRKAGCYILLIVCCTELTVNGILTLQKLHYEPLSDYQEFVTKTEPAVDYIKNIDKGLYRIEKTFHRKEDDPMLFDYKGLSHYSSSDKLISRYFMGQAGFRNNGNWAYYNRGSTFAMDSFLGVKYLLSREVLSFPYEKIDTVGDISIYRNQQALPLAFSIQGKPDGFDLNNSHKFDFQNQLFHALADKTTEDIFYPETIRSIETENLEVLDGGWYKKVQKGKPSILTYHFTAATSDPVFCYLACDEMKSAVITVNGKDLGKYFDIRQYDIIRLGSFKEGEDVAVNIRLKEGKLNVTDAWFYYQNMDVFEKYIQELIKNPVQVDSFSDTKLSGTVESLTDGWLFFTIPYERGWRLQIDGSNTPLSKSGEIFMTAPVSGGIHTIDLTFHPPGLTAGIIISVLCAVFFFVWILLLMKK